MKLQEKMTLIKLYDIYYVLLTKKQQEIFELYCDEDYTVTEIAYQKNISKAAVSKTINLVAQKLNDYEKNLKILENKQKNVELLSKNKISEKIISKIK